MSNPSYWSTTAQLPEFPALAEDIETDVLVIGGGITGVSCLHVLAEAGIDAVLLERDRLCCGDTSHTTAHLTYMTDTRLTELVRLCGKDAAVTAWLAGKAAMDHIEAVVKRGNIDCEWKQVSGYLVAASRDHLECECDRLREEAALAREMGLDAIFLDHAPPTGLPGVRFENQAQFHPLKYLAAIAREATGYGARVFEQTNVVKFGDDHVHANGHRIRCNKIVIATHVPLQGRAKLLPAIGFQTKIAPYSTYAIAAKIPLHGLPEMIWSNTADPFDYLRVFDTVEGRVAIFGGEDHKTGQVEDTAACFERLRLRLTAIVPEAEITHQWSGQVIEPVDGLPYIGENADHQFIASGFSGNGMTFGVAAALMLRDWLAGTTSPWQEAFAPGRTHLSATLDYIRENSDFPWRLVKDRLAIPEGSASEIAPGEGRVVKVDGKRVAVCRNPDGTLYELNAVCPHLGCIVAWNDAESTWDCPCHGSRFAADGCLLAGPAETNLEPATS